MICLLTKRAELSNQLKAALTGYGIDCQQLKPSARASVATLYDPSVVAAVVDAEMAALPEPAWLDMLASLGRRIPVIVMGENLRDRAYVTTGRYSDAVTWMKDPSANDIIAVLDACGAIGIDHRKLDREKIPIFNSQIPLHMLQNNGALSLLVINASSFGKIAIEYGGEAHRRAQDCFHQILYDLWGAPGSFRSADILCRRSAHSNTYFIFLEQSRTSSAVPAPGVLERLADRLSIRLQNAFWNELFRPRASRTVPDCIQVVPEISVGFATSIFNPCVDLMEHVEQLIERASQESKIQLKRMRDRQRELMQTLIQTPNLLMPHYQAVFRLDRITKQASEAAKAERSIGPLKHAIHGFESLIRVQSAAMDATVGEYGVDLLESRFLRPDVMFAMAHTAKLGLELDQACLHQAVVHSSELEGKLMVNILPRNLYNIDQLKHLIMDRRQIVFEVSETEAINNFDLMLKVRESLERNDMGIATDDFGRGYAGLEQIIKLKPDLIKLDRSLIQDIHLHQPKQAFVQGLIKAAKISGTQVLAEGVELWEEAELLQSMGCLYIQGFLLHRPQPAQEIVEQLRDKGVKKLSTVA